MAAEFIYLHGFASSPGSRKAVAFKKKFDALGLPLTVPDLEGGNFRELTLSRQIQTVQQCLDSRPGKRFGLIGSSMGGYLAALIAQLRPEVAALYLMAPGFNFLKRWRERLGKEAEDPGSIRVFHYRYEEERELSTQIFRDAERWEGVPLDRELPTRLVHGVHDASVDIRESRAFVKTRSWCRLRELDSDHGLISHVDWIIEDCLEFFRAQKLV